MRKLFGSMIALVVALSFVTVANAQISQPDDVTMIYKGITFKQTVRVYRDNQSWNVYAGQMNVTIDGEWNNAFCIDLDNSIYANQAYAATIVEAPLTTEVCKMAYILQQYEAVDNLTSAALQVAIWKLTYPNQSVWVNNPAVEALANDWIVEADGKCPLACNEEVELAIAIEGNMYGELVLVATLTAGGQPVPGEILELATDKGVLLGIVDGAAETDAEGKVYATIDLAGDALPVTVSAWAFGRTIYKIIPTKKVQQLQTLTYSDPCEYTDSASFDATPMGDPRTIGFWKHQAKTALGKNKNANQHVPTEMLLSWLPIEVFGLNVDSLQALYDALWVKNASMEQRAQQQCLATLLNVKYAQLGWFTDIDLDQDGEGDGYFWEFFLAANDAFYGGDFETAKTICDDINNL
jgi:hypothetical protein